MQNLQKRRLLVLPASKHRYLVFGPVPCVRASSTGVRLTPMQIQPCEQFPEGVVRCSGHSYFGLRSLWLCSGQVPHCWGHPNQLWLLQPFCSPFVPDISAYLSPETLLLGSGEPAHAALLVASRQGSLGQCLFCS